MIKINKNGILFRDFNFCIIVAVIESLIYNFLMNESDLL